MVVSEQFTRQNFFEERVFVNFLQRIEEHIENCKHIKHLYKILTELQKDGFISTEYSEKKTMDAGIELEDNVSLQRKVSGLKSKALEIATIAEGYAKKGDPSDKKFFSAIELLLNEFGRSSTDDFIFKKHAYLAVFKELQKSNQVGNQ